jgi:hypothetical protein
MGKPPSQFIREAVAAMLRERGVRETAAYFGLSRSAVTAVAAGAPGHRATHEVIANRLRPSSSKGAA